MPAARFRGEPEGARDCPLLSCRYDGPVSPPLRESPWRDPLLPAYLVVAATGLYLTSYGPSFSFVAADLGVSKATASLLLTALFCGGIAASALMAVRLHGGDKRRLGAIGTMVMVGGSLVMGASPWWPVALLGSAVVGFGDGLLVTAAHILVAEESPDVTRDMSRLNVSFASGAIVGPLWTGFALHQWGSRALLYLVLALITLPLAMLLGRSRTGLPKRPHPPGAPGIGLRGFDASVLILGGVLLVYIGCEAGLGAWVSTYTQESFGSGVMLGAAVTSGYWVALGLGRLVCSIASGRGTDGWKLLLTAVVVATCATIMLAASNGVLAVAAGAAFCAGLGFGPVWPATIGLASAGRRSQVPATLITVASVGGIVLPFSQGLILKAAGPSGIAFTAALCVAMLVLVIVARSRAAASGMQIARAADGTTGIAMTEPGR